MHFTRIAPDYAVAPQIETGDVAEIAAVGFRTIMCNRPDGEAADQPSAGTIRAEAEAQGLTFAFLPVVSGQLTGEDVEQFRAAMETLPQPVFAYCRSGTRSRNLWQLAQR
jgi:uncharacterized protein (TIGR01244 family)